MDKETIDDKVRENAILILNSIMEIELAGVVRYTHYSLMIYGYNRIPIVDWMKKQATESLDHAQRAGELVTMLGGHPSLSIGDLSETEKHDIGDILKESLIHEKKALEQYYELLKLSESEGLIIFEEYAREQISAEELHLDEVNKMLRTPGNLEIYKLK